MLSILIPTYNYDCLELVEELLRQTQTLSFPVEILVADDASKEEMKRNNRKINKLDNCMFIELKENVGISCIRNYLSTQAQYEFLLFLDSDVMPCKKDFLTKYMSFAQKSAVICGGLKFKRKIPEANQTLRYYYGTSIEEKSVEKRLKKPYAQFTSISFLIDKKTFMSIQFNESFTQYGHEDTFFGKELEDACIPVIHIENPIFHNVPDTNAEFIEKTKKSVENLIKNADSLKSYVKLLDVYKMIKSLGLRPFIAFFFIIGQKIMLKNLLSAHPNLKIFALYKLAYLCSLK